MVAVVPVPIILGKSTVGIGTNQYENGVSACTFVPTTPKARFKGIGGASYNAAGIPDWVANLDYAQDFATATSLANYLLANVGQTVAMKFYPVAGGPGYQASVMIEPGQIGGAVDAIATASISLNVAGQPTLITP